MPAPPARRGHEEQLIELELLLGRPAVYELDEPVAVPLSVVEHSGPLQMKEREGVHFISGF